MSDNKCTMKAAMLLEPGRVEVMDIPKPECPQGGVLLQVKACGLCGSDLRKFRAGHAHFEYPVLLGHEVSGVITESSRSDYKPGDRIAIGATMPCGSCTNCLKGLDNLCENQLYHGLGLYKEEHQGAYAEYVALDKVMMEKGAIVPIPENLDYAEAALIEPFTDVLNSHELITIRGGETALIIGAGPIGAMHVDLLQAKGVDCILADVSGERLQLAKKASGAKYLIDNSKMDLKDEVLKITENRGADIVIIACSVPSLQEHSLEFAALGGRIILFGGLNDKDKMLSMDAGLIHYNQLAVFGTTGSCKRHFTEIMAFLATGAVKTEEYITRMPLSEINNAIELAEKGKALKVILEP